MTALLSLATPSALEALPAAPGQPVAAAATPPGFAAMLAAAQPLLEAAQPIAEGAPPAPPAVTPVPAVEAVPLRYTPAQLWSLIDGETVPNLRATGGGELVDPTTTTDSALQTTETPTETQSAAAVIRRALGR